MFHRTIRMPASLWQAAADADYLNGLERVLYALRHLQHHVGELCAYQKAANLEPAQWK